MNENGREAGVPPRTIGETVRDLIDDAPDAARGAIDSGRDLYRRTAIAVARTAGDNGALMLLAGGAAIAGLSWLVARRRTRRTGR